MTVMDLSFFNRMPKYNAWLILIVALIITIIVWFMAERNHEKRGNEIFQTEVSETVNQIQQRMITYEHTLQSGIGLFQSSDYVTRNEWHDFVQQLHTHEYFPGIQGIGYAMILRPDQVIPIENKMRRDGYPSFTLKPAGKRKIYSSILYLEPMNTRNIQAIGYDMFSEPTRREAMERARDTGLAALSGDVTLVQEIDSNVQRGVLLYLPLYKNKEKINTVEERRKALIGYVYSPFRIQDLMHGIFHDTSLLNIEIYHSNGKNHQHAIYHSKGPSSYIPKYYTEESIHMGGQIWHLHFSSTPEFEASVSSSAPLFLAIGGSLFAFFLFFIILNLIRSRQALHLKHLALEETQSHLRTLLNSASDGIHIIDAEGNLLEYSDSFIKMLGYSDEEAKDLKIFDWDTHLSEADILNKLAEMPKKSMIFESKHRRKNGMLFDVEIATKPITLNGAKVIYASSRDITQRKKKLDELYLSQKMIDQSNDMIFIILIANGHIQYVNQTAQKMLGYTLEEMNAIGVNGFRRPFKEKEPFLEHLQKLKKIGRLTDYAILTRKDGSEFPAEANVSAVHYNDTDYNIAIVRDITDQQELENSLRIAKDAAESANKAKSAFLANMSHEIRTPLNGVIGLTDLVLQGDLQPLQRDYLTKAEMAAKALLEVLNDILDYSKIEAHKLVLESTRFDLNALLNNLNALFSYKAEEKHIELKFTIDSAVPNQLIGDPLRLQQILSNLIGNALKFTYSGHVHLSITSQPEGTHHKLHFDIADTGIGMTPKQRESLFHPFYQADSSFTRKYGGSGLGLMISKELVELMGGEISVVSTSKYGTTFTFTALFDSYEKSMKKLSEKIALTAPMDPFPANKKIHILLVEDNDLNQLVATEQLKKMGMIVSIANNGLEAVDMVKHNAYDAILMDLQMPVMDGFEATREIRKLEGKEKLPIIALSAAVMKEDQILATEAGMNAHIAKPIDKVALQNVLAKWLSV